ncbi:MAG: hypothetical protein R3E13_11625 [Alphaproteobacteria bacterium]
MSMDQRAAYLLQILETIGSPLMGAITAASHDNLQNDARSMAALLAKTVEASIELGNIMEINPAEAQDDTLRVALAGLAGKLVAGQYSKRGQIPESVELKKITGALQAVLTFSDNFTPTPETVERLKNLEASGQSVDAYQTQIQYMQAFIPVTEAIAAFPFGQPEAKLVMDVSERLVKKSVELRETLLPGISDEAAQKRAELGLLRGLATLYSVCHKAETDKVMNMDAEAQNGTLSIEPVWSAFELRAAMLEALAAKMAPGRGANVASSGGGGVAPAAAPTEQAPQTPAPAAAPVEQTAPLAPAQPPPAAETAPAAPPVQPETAVGTPPPAPPAAAPPAAPPTQAQQGANPMAMFAKPKEGAETAPPPAAAAPVPPPAETPPAAQAPVTPPADPPVPPPAAPPAPQPDQQSGGESGQGGGPMSFFKKKEGE